MKRIIIPYLLFPILLITAISCDTDGNIKDTSYISYKFSMFYPQGTTYNYEFVFNGKKGTSGIVSTSENTGLLEIYSKNNKDNPLFSQTITVTNDELQFIKIGNTVNIYKPEEYTSFTASMLSNDYSLWFNGYECINSVLNYIPNTQTEGSFEIKAKNDDTVLWTSTKRMINNGAKYTFMPLTKDEFLEVPEDTEPEPISDKECKVRIFYPNGLYDADSIRIDIYRIDEWAWDWISDVPITSSLIIKKGEISKYVTFDYSQNEDQYISFHYDITNANPDKNDEKYVNYKETGTYLDGSNEQIFSNGKVNFKKATLELFNKGTQFTLISSLSIKR